AQALAARSIANSAREAKAVYMASPFGNDTKVGSSKFQKSNEEAQALAARSIANSAREAKAVYMASP
ncbi:hypothetical protein QCO44_12455, partial [Selenomonas sputigena]